MSGLGEATSILLTSEERAELERLAGSSKTEHRTRFKARIVLMAAQPSAQSRAPGRSLSSRLKFVRGGAVQRRPRRIEDFLVRVRGVVALVAPYCDLVADYRNCRPASDRPKARGRRRLLSRFLTGVLDASNLFMPMWRIALRRQRGAYRSLLLPLHDLSGLQQEPLCRHDGFPSKSGRSTRQQHRHVQATPPAVRNRPRVMSGLRGARRKFHGVRPIEDGCFRALAKL